MSTSTSTEAPFSRAEGHAFLNRTLETERAGARALVAYLDDHARDSMAWKILRQVQADEAHNCALVGKLLDRDGVAHSHATGEFHAKAVAVSGAKARIRYLQRGLGWAVREFGRALPRLADAETRSLVARMRDSHRRSIRECQALVDSLPD
jgi:nitronate monooxygenase